tara:strand:+ start:2177 stop:3040 length:864 start_codon:yes stop_codon:yes gene_type:complete
LAYAGDNLVVIESGNSGIAEDRVLVSVDGEKVETKYVNPTGRRFHVHRIYKDLVSVVARKLLKLETIPGAPTGYRHFNSTYKPVVWDSILIQVEPNFEAAVGLMKKNLNNWAEQYSNFPAGLFPRSREFVQALSAVTNNTDNVIIMVDTHETEKHINMDGTTEEVTHPPKFVLQKAVVDLELEEFTAEDAIRILITAWQYSDTLHKFTLHGETVTAGNGKLLVHIDADAYIEGKDGFYRIHMGDSGPYLCENGKTYKKTREYYRDESDAVVKKTDLESILKPQWRAT